MRAVAIVGLALIMIADATARSPWLFPAPDHHRHRQHRRDHRTQPYDPTFCRDIIAAFEQLPVRGLDAYVSSIPEAKRKEAARCLKGKDR